MPALLFLMVSRNYRIESCDYEKKRRETKQQNMFIYFPFRQHKNGILMALTATKSDVERDDKVE